MTSQIEAILRDPALTVDDKVRTLTLTLHALPDRGVSEAVQFLLTTDDPTAATYPANYLALLPDLDAQKRQVVEHILDHKRDLMIAAVSLVRDMPEPIVDRLVEIYFAVPSAPGMDSGIYEVAMFFPSRLREHASRIEEGRLREMILPGGPDEWVDERVERYRRDRDPALLRELGRFRTDHALSAMLDLAPSVPEEDEEEFYAWIESSGVFPDTREASVYFTTYRGRVVDPAESPHALGGPLPGPVPACALCDKPADRVLTLKRDALDLDVEGICDPTFFWIRCPHAQDSVIARLTRQGVEPVLTARSEGPAATDLIPGERALLLEPHTNQCGYGREVTPGYGLHQVGGYPPWVKLDRLPRCPDCGQGMRYLASIDSGMTPSGEIALEGMLQGFWCERCSVSVTRFQGV